jgi:sugar/nucleoside kinase (ribokinase family)
VKILAIGTCCVDVYPQKNVVTPGGEALNIAAQLSSRTDVDIYLMGMIGNDTYAQNILESINNLSSG